MLQWIKELYAEFTPRAFKVLVTLIAVIGFGAFVLVTSQPQKVSLSDKEPSEAAEVSVNQAKIFVHIAGKVKHPGIYQLDSGARVFDVVLLAGGFTKKANQSSINLARVVTDGEQIVIGSGTSQELLNNSQSFISLNQSSVSTLEDLPGVGPALAGRIVDWREANGGFKSKEDLLNVAGIGDKLYSSIKDLVTL
ncbi:MAG: ComEA family DNA-binding protein [Actinobacteria bacterium]|nr:ComEA family DNA-binding protein [Actinomycetota bacterium]